MATQDQMREDEASFADAFNDDAPATAEMSEDEAFGLNVPEDGASQGETSGEGEPAAVAIVVADEEALDESAGKAMADATVDEASAQPGQEDEGPLDPKEEQRRKSWEGRLRAREEELAKREAALKSPAAKEEPASEAIEQAAETLAAEGDVEGADAADAVAERVESGELTADQAMKILAEDFGPEFVKMIETIAAAKANDAASKVATEKTAELGRSVQEIIDDIVDTKAKGHFEQIAAKHPDFNDVAQSPEFAEFTRTYENGEQIASAGSAADINKMLDAFKSQQRPAEPEAVDPAIDAAEGVRSAGLKLPDAPSKADGFEDAWNEF